MGRQWFRLQMTPGMLTRGLSPLHEQGASDLFALRRLGDGRDKRALAFRASGTLPTASSLLPIAYCHVRDGVHKCVPPQLLNRRLCLPHCFFAIGYFLVF